MSVVGWPMLGSGGCSMIAVTPCIVFPMVDLCRQSDPGHQFSGGAERFSEKFWETDFLIRAAWEATVTGLYENSLEKNPDF